MPAQVFNFIYDMFCGLVVALTSFPAVAFFAIFVLLLGVKIIKTIISY